MKHEGIINIIVAITVTVVGYGLINQYFFAGPTIPPSIDERLQAILQEPEEPLIAIQNHFDDLIADYGVEGTLGLVEKAFINHNIDLVDCHVLSHNLGHEALIYYNYDFNKALDNESHFCIRGYRHGIESQIVTDIPDYIPELRAFCKELNARLGYAECYHGAGHEFMKTTLEVAGSLELCDELGTEEYSYVTDCHKGVFAELTNLVGGFDGETGMYFSGAPPMNIEDEPLAYCITLNEKYQESCVYEFAGRTIGRETDTEHILGLINKCVENDYSITMQRACIYSISAVFTQHEIGERNQVVFLPIVYELDEELRFAYLEAVSQEIRQFVLSGRNFDGKPFCQMFKSDKEKEFCLKNILPSSQPG